MVVEFARGIRELMKEEKISIEKSDKTAEWIQSGLLELCHRMVYSSSTLALIGDINPTSLEKDFQLFDKKFHYFIAPLPRWVYSWFFPQELAARTRLNNSWLENRDPPGVSQFHRDRVELFTNNSQWVSDQHHAALLTVLFWSSLANTIPGVFWSLFYILKDPKALQTIKEEIDTHLPVVPLDGDKGVFEDWTPEQLDLCVYLESAVNEAIRLVAAPLMTRKCIRPAELVLQDGRNIKFKIGETLAWFGGVSHFDPKLFPEPTKFIFDRFLNKKVDTVAGYMPFGGGKSICPGRFFARFEIKTCVAMILRYMEYKLEDAETVPSQLIARIGIGISPPNKDIPILYRYKL
jgi:oxysterol 7-alpha-hydroxylase